MKDDDKLYGIPAIFGMDEGFPITHRFEYLGLSREVRMRGKIKTLNSRGFGFITYNDIDYFFHYTDYVGDWKPLIQMFILSVDSGKSVEVEFEHDKSSTSGPKAIKVKLVEAK